MIFIVDPMNNGEGPGPQCPTKVICKTKWFPILPFMYPPEEE